MKYFSSKIKKSLPRIAVIAAFLCLCVMPVASQSSGNENFPAGSTNGTTEMSQRVTGIDIPNIEFSAKAPQTGKEVAFSVQLLLMLTLLSLAPSLIILTTTFLRFSIVLDFIKRALSLQQVPPTAVLNGIALFMTLFCMWPTFKNVEDDTSYIATFMSMVSDKRPRTLSDVPTYVLIPAYILHELTVAFKIGVLLYIPFIIIDMVVASILMSMGMMMLPPTTISMPFKILLFVLADGWNLIIVNLVKTFY